MDGMLKFSNLS